MRSLPRQKPSSTSIPRFDPSSTSGGEDSKLILLEEEDGHLKIGDFSMNTLCAAGTGSFLDQQASRLGFTIEEFGELALKSKTPPRIAGRCSVFAKSDMIHLQQIATPDYDIVAGLCYAMARNFKSNVGKGKGLRQAHLLQGGVAANLGMRKAFREVLEVSDGELIIPTHFASMGAIGAILVTHREQRESREERHWIWPLCQYLEEHQEETLPSSLSTSLPVHLARERASTSFSRRREKKVEAYLGSMWARSAPIWS